MKIIITPQKINFIYSLYRIETSGEKIKYFFDFKKENKKKFNINIDLFGLNDESLKIALGDRKVSSLTGPFFGFAAFFLNRMFSYIKTEKNGCISLDMVAMDCCEYDISIFGKERIRSFLRELKINHYPVDDVITKFENLVK